jgi:hypothetical protein
MEVISYAIMELAAQLAAVRRMVEMISEQPGANPT